MALDRDRAEVRQGLVERRRLSRSSGARVDPDDARRRRALPAAEEIHGAVDDGGGRVVRRLREAADDPQPVRRPGEDRVERASSRIAAEHHQPAVGERDVSPQGDPSAMAGLVLPGGERQFALHTSGPKLRSSLDIA